jgi:hypothetical protein
LALGGAHENHRNPSFEKVPEPLEAFEGDGVQPAFPTKQHAIDYASNRFGGSRGEIHVYDDAGENMVEKIAIDDRIKYPRAD